eukprot:c48542_g1_i1 orf=185-337(+)
MQSTEHSHSDTIPSRNSKLNCDNYMVADCHVERVKFLRELLELYHQQKSF